MNSNTDSFQLDFRDDGFVYQNDVKFDTLSAKGAGIKNGECIFAVAMDGSIYTNNPYIPLARSNAHAELLHGHPMMCMGLLRAHHGVIHEITVDINLNKSSRTKLLEFLSILRDKYKLDLSKINIIDQFNGSPKNAEQFLKSNGYCLPCNMGEYLLKLAVESEKKGCKRECKEYLDQAIEHGNGSAQLTKAMWLIERDDIYPSISLQEKFKQAKQIIIDLAFKEVNPAILLKIKLLWVHKLGETEELLKYADSTPAKNEAMNFSYSLQAKDTLKQPLSKQTNIKMLGSSIFKTPQGPTRPTRKSRTLSDSQDFHPNKNGRGPSK